MDYLFIIEIIGTIEANMYNYCLTALIYTMMLFFILISQIIHFVVTQENLEAQTGSTNTKEFISSNTSFSLNNETIIRKDSSMSTNENEMISVSQNISSPKKSKEADEFRPSPQVKEIIYEKNMFPVKPAFPEAKQYSSRDNEYSKTVNLAWKRPEEQPWISTNNLRFPLNHVPTSNDRPYKFTSEGSNYNQGFSGKYDEGGLSKSQISLGSKVPVSASGPGSGTGVGGSWEIFGNLYPDHKYTQRGPTYGYDYGGYNDKPLTSIEHQHPYSYPMKKHENPWKKIIKILAAFIPIGLLISAITPTIITVSPVNNTMMRSRNNDPHSDTIKKLVNSLGYFDELNNRDCQNRILCELLLSASSSQNAEQHIENFLNNFSDREKYSTERVTELKMIFKAVKEQKCENINCEHIKDDNDNT